MRSKKRRSGNSISLKKKNMVRRITEKKHLLVEMVEKPPMTEAKTSEVHGIFLNRSVTERTIKKERMTKQATSRGKVVQLEEISFPETIEQFNFFICWHRHPLVLALLFKAVYNKK